MEVGTPALAAQPLSGRVVVVTGAASGIGAAIATDLSALGATIVIIDRDAGGAEKTASNLPGPALGLAADVREYNAVRDAVRRTRDEFGGLDLLVNNAGWDRMQPFLDNDPALWDTLLDINIKGVFNATHSALPLLIERGGGRIVNIASDAGRVGSSGEVAYSACKGAVIAFTKAVAREAARHGIAVNCVCPGPTDTPLLRSMLDGETGDKIIRAMTKATPMRRLAEPDEIASAVAFFASASTFITGQVLSVSGGLTMAG